MQQVEHYSLHALSLGHIMIFLLGLRHGGLGYFIVLEMES